MTVKLLHQLQAWARDFNSMAPGRFGGNVIDTTFKLILVINGLGIAHEISTGEARIEVTDRRMPCSAQVRLHTEAERGLNFLCLENFRLGSAGEPNICSHCYDVLNEVRCQLFDASDGIFWLWESIPCLLSQFHLLRSSQIQDTIKNVNVSFVIFITIQHVKS